MDYSEIDFSLQHLAGRLTDGRIWLN